MKTREWFFSHMEVVGDCWLFIGPINYENGYGKTNQGLAHRVAYETFVGPIPPGMHIDHVRSKGCLSHLCINPAHLEAVTQAENNRRTSLEECGRGHRMSGENLYVSPQGIRWCRACRKIHRRNAYLRQKVMA